PDKNQLSAARASAEGFRYDRVQRSRQTEQLIAAFPIAPKAIEAQTRPTPIFIVGMPRSGTTLVESILGAHSKVFACGERQAMRGVMQEFTALETGISAIAAATRRRWRESYVRELPALGGATAITDKNPWNFDALGMIFPRRSRDPCPPRSCRNGTVDLSQRVPEVRFIRHSTLRHRP